MELKLVNVEKDNLLAVSNNILLSLKNSVCQLLNET